MTQVAFSKYSREPSRSRVHPMKQTGPLPNLSSPSGSVDCPGEDRTLLIFPLVKTLEEALLLETGLGRPCLSVSAGNRAGDKETLRFCSQSSWTFF